MAVDSAVRPEAGDEGLEIHDGPGRESRRSLHRTVWLLAWPTVISMLLQTTNMMLDRMFVGHLGSDSLAAVGVGGQLMFLLFSVGISISVGTTALVARFTGAREPEQSRLATSQSLWLAAVASLVCIAVFLVGAEPAVRAMGIAPSAADQCVRYLMVALMGLPFLFVSFILSATLRGLGDMVRPMQVGALCNVVHVGGDYLLIFGHAGFPKLGLPGGALAQDLSLLTGCVLYLIMIRRSSLRWSARDLGRMDFAWTRRIARIAVPAIGQNFSRILSLLAFTGVLAKSPDGTAAVAALTIGMTSESLAFMPGFAYSVAAGTLTGQNLGAGDPRRAERASWAALQQGLSIMCVMGIVFYAWARPLAHAFLGGANADPRVIPLAITYLRTQALAEPFLGLGMILTGALNGAGDTRAPAWLSVICMWGFRLPVGYLAASAWGYGATGAWWAMAGSTILAGIGTLALFKWGAWKRTKV